jgi:hypothetical protein
MHILQKELVTVAEKLASLMQIRIRDLLDLRSGGSGIEKFGSGIQYKHPGPATLLRRVGKGIEHIEN